MYFVKKIKNADTNNKTMNELLNTSIISELKDYGIQKQGKYTRVYPENRDATTSRMFEMYLELERKEEIGYYKAIFQFFANEDRLILNDKKYEYYSTFYDKQATFRFIHEFLDPFKFT